MNTKKAERIIQEINEEHGLELTLFDVIDEANITEEELRTMALRAGGIEEPEEEPEEPTLELGGKTEKELEAELHRRGVDLADLGLTQLRKEAEEHDRKRHLAPGGAWRRRTAK